MQVGDGGLEMVFRGDKCVVLDAGTRFIPMRDGLGGG